MDHPAPWCDAFVDWCFQEAYGVSNAKSLLGGNFNDYTVASAQLYKNKNAWYSSPKVGDQIFFKNSQRICHTGLVYKVTDTRVYTIEGNTSGASGVIANGGGVCKKSYALSYSQIAGYGRPKYDKAESISTITPVKKSINEVAKEVIAGKYGSGVERKKKLEAEGYDYATVQAEVNKILKGTSTTTKIETVKKEETKKKIPTNITANVRSVQKWLNTYYKTGLTVDGDYGKKTKAALVKAWQTEVGGLTVDGSFGPKSKAKASSVNLNKGDDGILVTILQATLFCQGFAPGYIDGEFGSRTRTAVLSAQKKHKLTRDGIVGSKTWNALFN